MPDRSAQTPPVFTVITAVLNGAAHLQQTIDSVATQRDVRVEHIVIDGGSTDSTVEILRRNDARLAHWSSAPDQGIADAMNRGIRHARGEWLLFLNADDFLLSPSSLASTQPFLDEDLDIVGFSIDYLDSSGAARRLSPGGMRWWRNFKMGFLHQGTLIRRSLFDRLGAYDLRFRTAMDFEFFLRAHRHRACTRQHPEVVLAAMRAGGVGSRADGPSQQRRFAEERLAHELHTDSVFRRGLYAVYWALYLPYRRLRNVIDGSAPA